MTFTMGNTPLQHWRVAAAGCGLAGGMVCALIGSLLSALSWFVREPQSERVLHTLGGGILCLTVPLLLLGGFCLDGPTPNRTRQTHAVEDAPDKASGEVEEN